MYIERRWKSRGVHSAHLSSSFGLRMMLVLREKLARVRQKGTINFGALSAKK